MQGRCNRMRLRGHAVLLLAVVVSMATASSASAAPQPWQREPSPNVESEFTYDVLHSTFAASPAEAWAVGEARPPSGKGFEPLAEEWTGSAWKIVPTANLGAEEGAATPFNGVGGTGPEDVWAVGENRQSSGTTPVVEKWNGSSWTQATLPAVKGGLLAVSADSANDVWAVGALGETTSTGNNAFSTGPLIEHFNGKSWSESESAAGAGNEIIAVAAVSPTDVWALGLSKVGRRGAASGAIEHFNGTAWSVAVALPSGTLLSSISATSENNVWAVGGNTVEHFNGSEWVSVTPPVPPAATEVGLSGVSALSATDVWAVGTVTRQVSDGIEGTTIETAELTEQWNGSTWTVVPSDSSYGATSVSGLAGGPLFAVGAGPGSENRTFILRQPMP